MNKSSKKPQHMNVPCTVAMLLTLLLLPCGWAQSVPDKAETSATGNSSPRINGGKVVPTFNDADSDLKNLTPEEKELKLYKNRMYREVGSRWMLSAKAKMPSLEVATVKIKLTVKPTGELLSVEIVEIKGDDPKANKLLEEISLDAIKRSSPFEPFPQSIKAKYPKLYEDEFTFAILADSN